MVGTVPGATVNLQFMLVCIGNQNFAADTDNCVPSYFTTPPRTTAFTMLLTGTGAD